MIWQGKKEVYGYRTENFKMGSDLLNNKIRKSWIWGNIPYKFRSVVSEVSFLVGNLSISHLDPDSVPKIMRAIVQSIGDSDPDLKP